MKTAALLSSLLAAGIASCAPAPAPEPALPRAEARSVDGFDRDHVRQEVETHIAARLGGEAARRVAQAPTSVMVTHHQGFPRPIQNPDGSVSYEPPGANAAVRGSAGWTGWAGTAQRSVAAARAAEIDRILADPRFWAEPDHLTPTCTDAGARRLVVRHAGRIAVRQQGCGGEGLTGRLWELVFGGPG